MADLVCVEGSGQIEDSDVWQIYCVQKVAVREDSEVWQI